MTVPYSETDSTPVFYASGQFMVTGMRIAYRSAIFPVPSVSGVGIVGRPFEFLENHLKACGGGLLIAVMAAVLGAVFPTRVGPLPMWPMLVMAGLLMVCLGVLGMAQYFGQKIVLISFQSGDSVRIPVWERSTAWAMRDAVDRALTYNINASRSPVSPADELGRLSQLRAEGAISDLDWERAKDLYLGKRPDARQAMIEQLRGLHDLHRRGALSESEFNMKKWDVLSQKDSAAYPGRPTALPTVQRSEQVPGRSTRNLARSLAPLAIVVLILGVGWYALLGPGWSQLTSGFGTSRYGGAASSTPIGSSQPTVAEAKAALSEAAPPDIIAGLVSPDAPKVEQVAQGTTFTWEYVDAGQSSAAVRTIAVTLDAGRQIVGVTIK
jgi:hypothetical protein